MEKHVLHTIGLRVDEHQELVGGRGAAVRESNQQICVESARARTVPIVDAMLVADGPARREGLEPAIALDVEEAAAFDVAARASASHGTRGRDRDVLAARSDREWWTELLQQDRRGRLARNDGSHGLFVERPPRCHREDGKNAPGGNERAERQRAHYCYRSWRGDHVGPVEAARSTT